MHFEKYSLRKLQMQLTNLYETRNRIRRTKIEMQYLVLRLFSTFNETTKSGLSRGPADGVRTEEHRTVIMSSIFRVVTMSFEYPRNVGSYLISSF